MKKGGGHKTGFDGKVLGLNDVKCYKQTFKALLSFCNLGVSSMERWFSTSKKDQTENKSSSLFCSVGKPSA